jgi:aspartyl-tRNA(Asn)/glutamyl-tRNA(Gln) amidotransferase subunit B
VSPDAGDGEPVGEGGEGDAPGVRIGLEVHVQLRTATKMFCGCPAEYGGEPNSRVCPVCLGLPGALPVPNERAVDLALAAAHALRCTVAPRSRFDRKNYFYPDLPKGYQITQYHEPLARHGRLPVPLEAGEREVRIRRLHLEEDAGKLLHDRFPDATAVDLNRAGVPLVEIVTEPDLRSPGEARAFLTRLKQVLEHFAGVSDGNMEEGSLRVDANLSLRRDGLRPEGGSAGAARTEVKNLNSFRFVEKALSFERDRQRRLRASGRTVDRETRTWDAGAGETRPMRVKEEAFDYRYFPEPDLPPLELSEGRIEAARDDLPELPAELERRLAGSYGLTAYEAARMAAHPARAAFFESAAGDRDEAFARQVANFVMGPMAEARNRRDDELWEPDLLAPDALARVVELRLDGTLSSTTADRALELLVEEEGADPDRLIREHGLVQVRDVDRLASWVEDAVADHPEEAGRYASGEEKLLGFFMGAVMRRADGKADPEEARRLLEQRLEEVEAP